MDLNKIGFAVGIIALLLAIPLAIIANLLTPRVREWYGTTSISRTKKRIALLEGKLSEAERHWKFSEAEWQIYNLVTWAFFIIGSLSCFSLLSLTPHVPIASLLRTSFTKPVVTLLILEVMILSLTVGVFAFLMFVLTWREKFREMHTLQGTQTMREEIARLNALLAKNAKVT